MSYGMDNFRIDITARGSVPFVKAMELAFGSQTADGYWISAEKGLVFSWGGNQPTTVRFPFKMDAAGAADFAQRWLSAADYGKQPDHDGDNTKGWRLYNEGWGHVGSDHYAIVAVMPAWAMHGK